MIPFETWPGQRARTRPRPQDVAAEVAAHQGGDGDRRWCVVACQTAVVDDIDRRGEEAAR